MDKTVSTWVKKTSSAMSPLCELTTTMLQGKLDKLIADESGVESKADLSLQNPKVVIDDLRKNAVIILDNFLEAEGKAPTSMQAGG